MKRLLLTLLLVSLAHAGTPEDRNVLVMDSDDGGLWHSFQSAKQCLGLRAVKMLDKSDHEMWRWSLAVAGNGRGEFEVLLIEMPTKHNVFFGANIPKGVNRACAAINEELKRER